MLSREKDFVRFRDDFSVFLSQLRSTMSAGQFRIILRTQQIADCHWSQGSLDLDWFNLWYLEISTTLDSLNRGLISGRWRRDEIARLIHLYRHILDN